MRKKFIRFLKLAAISTILFYILKFLIENINSINFNQISFDYSYLFFSIVLYFSHILFNIYIWFVITIQNKCSINLFETFKTRIYADFGKYIPGKVFSYGMLFYSYEKRGVSKRKIMICSLQEAVLSILAPGIITLICMFFLDLKEIESYKYLVFVLILICLFFVNPKFLNYFIDVFFKLIKKESIKISTTYFQIIYVLGLSILSWVFYGWSIFFFINSFYNCSVDNYFFITGAFSISALVGFLALFAPGGIGVREGMLMYTLSLIFPSAVSALIALISRLWSTVLELILFFIFYFLGYWRKKRIKAMYTLDRKNNQLIN